MNNDKRYFQWIAGDQKGQIQIFDRVEQDEENVYIVFKDSSRINESFVAELNKTDLTGKLMAEIDHPNNCWQFKEEWVGREEEVWETNADGEKVCVQPFVPGKKIIRLTPPKKSAPRASNFGNISNPISPPPIPPEFRTIENSSSADTSDPIYILMSKSKKVDSEIFMNLTISLPPKNLYNIAKESFDDGDKKFVEYIIQNITVKEIKDALKTAITDMYETQSNSINGNILQV